MAIPLADNYNYLSSGPLDAKQVVSSKTALQNISSPYNGLIVFIEDTNTIVCCFDEDGVLLNSLASGEINDAVWKTIPIAGGDGAFLAHDITYDPDEANFAHYDNGILTVKDALDALGDLYLVSTTADITHSPASSGVAAGYISTNTSKNALDYLAETQETQAGSIATNAADIATNTTAISNVDTDQVFVKSGIPIKNIPTTDSNNNTFGTPTTGTVSEWLQAAFFPFVAASGSSTMLREDGSDLSNTTMELGESITGTIGLTGTWQMDSGDSVSDGRIYFEEAAIGDTNNGAFSGNYQHDASGNAVPGDFTVPGAGDPKTITLSDRNFGVSEFDDTVRFKMSAVFANNGSPATIQTPVRTVTFKARSFWGHTATQSGAGLAAELRGMQATGGTVGLLSGTGPFDTVTGQHLYIGIPLRENKYLQQIVQAGGNQIGSWEIVTDLVNGTVKDTTNNNEIPNGLNGYDARNTSDTVDIPLHAEASRTEKYIVYRREEIWNDPVIPFVGFTLVFN